MDIYPAPDPFYEKKNAKGGPHTRTFLVVSLFFPLGVFFFFFFFFFELPSLMLPERPANDDATSGGGGKQKGTDRKQEGGRVCNWFRYK